MPIITAKELALLCSIAPKNVHTYVSRGKLIKRPDGLFDTNNIANKDFIEKCIINKKIKLFKDACLNYENEFSKGYLWKEGSIFIEVKRQYNKTGLDKKEYRKEYSKTEQAKLYRKKYYIKQKEKLSDIYIKGLLGINNNELIELKRVQLMINRELKAV